jgi:hypothetical protein
MRVSVRNMKSFFRFAVVLVTMLVGVTFVMANSATAVVIGEPATISAPVAGLPVMQPLVAHPVALQSSAVVNPVFRPFGFNPVVRPFGFNPFFSPFGFDPFFRPFFNPFVDVDVGLNPFFAD